MAYLCETERKWTLARVIGNSVTHWSDGNELHYGLSMFVEFGNVC